MMVVTTIIVYSTNKGADSARHYQPWNNSPGCTAITLRTEKLKSTKDLTEPPPAECGDRKRGENVSLRNFFTNENSFEFVFCFCGFGSLRWLL